MIQTLHTSVAQNLLRDTKRNTIPATVQFRIACGAPASR
jgi:hypothetical protein